MKDTELKKRINDERKLLTKSKKNYCILSISKGLRLWIFATHCEWEFRVQGKIPARQKLGSYPTVSLAEANHQAAELLARWSVGEDVRKLPSPVPQKNDRLKTKSLNELIPDWITYERDVKKSLHGKDLTIAEARYRKYIKPIIGTKRPADVLPEEIAQIMNPLHENHPGMAEKIKALLNKIFYWARDAVKIIDEDKRLPVETRAIEPFLLIRKKWGKQGHHPMCPIERLPYFIAELVSSPAFNSDQSAGYAGILFAILTCARFSNIGKNNRYRPGSVKTWAIWDDFSDDLTFWSIPAEKMKKPENGNHDVPLSTACQKLLRRLQLLGLRGKETAAIVFPTRYGTPYTETSFRGILQDIHKKNLEHGDIGFLDPNEKDKKGRARLMTLHGTARATFRSWAQDNQKNENIAEHCLHHRRRKAYARGKVIEAKRQLLEEWGEFCLSRCPKDWDSL